MLTIHPWARLAVAGLLIAAVFLADQLATVAIVYAAVVVVVLMTGTIKSHIQFVTFVSLPLLVALIVVWQFAVDPGKVPPPHSDGLTYALFMWLRVIASGGVLQSLFLPLVERPAHLRTFLHKTGLSGSFGTLVVTSIVFLPEVRRRLERIVDARKAQGYTVSGIGGLIALPALMMPLVSSLLDSATIRAELWSHRGILERKPVASNLSSYSIVLSLFAVILALAVLGFTITA
jgi:energy-coupling factor transporter transmembrane protein EcfT